MGGYHTKKLEWVVDGLPPGVDPNKGPFDLTFTVLEGQRAYEVTTRLD